LNKAVFCLALAGSVAGTAQAQNTYQANRFRTDMCTLVARTAKNAWSYKMTGKPFPMHTITPQAESPLAVLQLWTINYAMNESPNEADAMNVSYAK
jgi:hypothetical protein